MRQISVLFVGFWLAGCAVTDRFDGVNSVSVDEQTYIVACSKWESCEIRSSRLCPSGFGDLDTDYSDDELIAMGVLKTNKEGEIQNRPEIVRAIECAAPVEIENLRRPDAKS